MAFRFVIAITLLALTGCSRQGVNVPTPPATSGNPQSFDQLLAAHRELQREHKALRKDLEKLKEENSRLRRRAGYQVSGKVIAVTGGDTLTLLRDGSEYEIRLHGIDAPDVGQTYNKVAREELTDICLGRVVEFEKRDIDHQGNMVAIVRCNGQNVSQLMLLRGAAWHYTKYDKSMQLAEAQCEAKQANRGLWSNSEAISPWDWRQMSDAERSTSADSGDE